MKFGEKVKELRIAKNLSQTELARKIGVSMRTIRGWEIEGRFPKQRSLYMKLSEVLGCDISYLMSNEESFVTEASELYGSRGAKQAQQILEQTAALFAGGTLSEDDQLEFITEIQSLYLDSKKRAKKFTPKKNLTSKPDASK
jgi:transcriptional regulator with XRE-family HTH domain